MSNKQIWVIDDDEIFHLIINSNLNSLHLKDFTIRFFESGSLAINELKQKQNFPGLIFLDIYMPLLDGWGVLSDLQKIKSPATKTRVCIVTSSIDRSDKQKAFTYEEVIEFLIKPVRKEELFRVIQDTFDFV